MNQTVPLFQLSTVTGSVLPNSMSITCSLKRLLTVLSLFFECAQFSSLNVEEDVDYVEVWSGTRSVLTSQLQARLTGTLTNRRVYGHNNFLIVRLMADLTNQSTGFTAQWEAGLAELHRSFICTIFIVFSPCFVSVCSRDLVRGRFFSPF